MLTRKNNAYQPDRPTMPKVRPARPAPSEAPAEPVVSHVEVHLVPDALGGPPMIVLEVPHGQETVLIRLDRAKALAVYQWLGDYLVATRDR